VGEDGPKEREIPDQDIGARNRIGSAQGRGRNPQRNRQHHQEQEKEGQVCRRTREPHAQLPPSPEPTSRQQEQTYNRRTRRKKGRKVKRGSSDQQQRKLNPYSLVPLVWLSVACTIHKGILA